MRVLVSGSSGLIGTAFSRAATTAGHSVFRLVRRPPGARNEISWDPQILSLDAAALDNFDAVVNFSGASLARLPWTPGYRTEILRSRVQATRTLTDAMRRAARPPGLLLNASAIGIYGDRPGEVLTEDAAPADDFLASVVATWEGEAHRAPEPTRVVTFRTGLVLARHGALAPLIPLTRLGLAGPLGRGTQQWSWISLHDEAAALVHLLDSELSGPVNLVAPHPASANDVMRALAHALHRPFLLPVPEKVLTLALQDAARQLLLADQRVSSQKLQDDGFQFTHRTPTAAIEWMLQRS
ncbi:TIGR01777 family oxidoreductase [Leifsonia kafniensis]|uniref:TIGR01777 family oxidoreductase n=1 Tax=Leifsonia kafniensis TaxID=475957 RepID=A0ABP7L8N1_9MICO